MAENIEKQITIKINGAEKVLANLEDVEKALNDIRSELAGLSKVPAEASMKKLAKETANAEAAQKKLGRSIKDVARNLASAEGGFTGFAKGFLAGGAIGLASDALSKVTDAVYELITAESAAEKATNAFNKAVIDSTESVVGEIVALEANSAILLDTANSTEDRTLALEALQEIFPGYLDNLDVEKSTTEEISAAINAVTNSLRLQIEQRALASRAEQLYIDKLNAQLLLDKARKALNQAGFLSAITGQTTALTQAITIQTKAVEDANQAYDDNLKLLVDATEQTNKLSEAEELAAEKKKAQIEASKTSDERAKDRVEKLKTTSLEGVKDLDSAIQRLNEAKTNSSLDEIKNLQELVRLYEEVAIAKTQAAEPVSSSGKTQQELKDELIQANARLFALTDERTEFKLGLELEISQFIELGKSINDAGETLFQFRDKQTGVLQDITKFTPVLQQIQKESESIADTLIKGFNAGFEFPKLDAYFTELESLYKRSNDAQIELDALSKQQSTTSTDIAAIRKKANDAILDAEEAVTEREKEINKKRVEALLAEPAILAAALEAAGETSFEKLKENRQKQIEAVFESDLLAIQQRAQTLGIELNKLFGKDIIQGQAGEKDFTILPDSGLAKDQIAEYTSILNSFNEEVKAAGKRRKIDTLNNENDVADQLIKNAAIASKAQIRQDRADQKTIELNFKAEKERLYALDKESSDNRKNLKIDANQAEIDEVNSHIDQLIEIKKAEIQKELDVETKRYIDLLNQAQGNAESQLTVLQELKNKEAEILSKGKSELEDIGADFIPLLGGSQKDTKAKIEQFKNDVQEILNDITPYVQLAGNLINSVFDLLIQNQQGVIDSINEQIATADTALSDTQSKLDELEQDLADRRNGQREADLRAIEQQKEREEDLARTKLELQRQLAAEEKKQANLRKGQAISQAIISGALGIMQGYAQLGPVGGSIAAAITAVVTGIQIAMISKQKFADGGYTSDGMGGERDETGHIPVGVVHQNEWVAPEWMTQSPKYAPMINSLESARKNGFAGGGFTSPDFGALSSSVGSGGNMNIMSMVQRSIDASFALSNRPVIASPMEFVNVNNKVAKRVVTSTIGG